MQVYCVGLNTCKFVLIFEANMLEQHIYKPGIMYHYETYLTEQLTELQCSDSRNTKIEKLCANMVVTATKM